MGILILLRHGQSTGNPENRFTGSEDVDLTSLGIEEARNASLFLKYYTIDFAFSSVLKRAVHTLEIILNNIGLYIPVFKSSALNERDYGDLQGLNKTATIKKYGETKVLDWRRSYQIAPPNGESLKDTYHRVIPYYLAEIEPKLKAGKTILIVAHGNSLRALVMYLEVISEKYIANFEIATGVLRVYHFDEKLKIIAIS
jgi:2,3-bisphosphoglycerate-dependent phosphoglycerate mutase